jgi:hypothetical protein
MGENIGKSHELTSQIIKKLSKLNNKKFKSPNFKIGKRNEDISLRVIHKMHVST